MAVAGRVLMIPAGTWTSGTNYGMLDVVIYAGSSYVAKKQINNSTVAPPNAASDWQLLAQGYDVTNVVTKSMIVNNFLATDPNTVLSGPMGKSLKDQLETVNSNLNNRGVVTQIAVITATGATTVPNMSAYKYIYACGMQGTNNAVCSVFAPYSVFKGDALLYASFYDGSTVRQFSIRATNDTTVNISVITNCSNGVTIYGIK